MYGYYLLNTDTGLYAADTASGWSDEQEHMTRFESWGAATEASQNYGPEVTIDEI